MSMQPQMVKCSKCDKTLRQPKHPIAVWPVGPMVMLKCEDEQPCFDQRPFVITVKDETAEAWIGWPHTWKERLYDGTLTSIGLPLSFPKFAWKEVK
jgi:hypothetical protein